MSRENYDPIESCADSLRDIRDSLDAIVGALVNPADAAPQPERYYSEREANAILRAARPDTDTALREAARAVLADYDLTGIDLELPDDPLMADLRAALAATEGE